MGNQQDKIKCGSHRDKNRPDTKAKNWSFHSMNGRKCVGIVTACTKVLKTPSLDGSPLIDENSDLHSFKHLIRHRPKRNANQKGGAANAAVVYHRGDVVRAASAPDNGTKIDVLKTINYSEMLSISKNKCNGNNMSSPIYGSTSKKSDSFSADINLSETIQERRFLDFSDSWIKGRDKCRILKEISLRKIGKELHNKNEPLIDNDYEEISEVSKEENCWLTNEVFYSSPSQRKRVVNNLGNEGNSCRPLSLLEECCVVPLVEPRRTMSCGAVEPEECVMMLENSPIITNHTTGICVINSKKCENISKLNVDIDKYDNIQNECLDNKTEKLVGTGAHKLWSSGEWFPDNGKICGSKQEAHSHDKETTIVNSPGRMQSPGSLTSDLLDSSKKAPEVPVTRATPEYNTDPWEMFLDTTTLEYPTENGNLFQNYSTLPNPISETIEEDSKDTFRASTISSDLSAFSSSVSLQSSSTFTTSVSGSKIGDIKCLPLEKFLSGPFAHQLQRMHVMPNLSDERNNLHMLELSAYEESKSKCRAVQYICKTPPIKTCEQSVDEEQGTEHTEQQGECCLNVDLHNFNGKNIDQQNANNDLSNIQGNTACSSIVDSVHSEHDKDTEKEVNKSPTPINYPQIIESSHPSCVRTTTNEAKQLFNESCQPSQPIEANYSSGDCTHKPTDKAKRPKNFGANFSLTTSNLLTTPTTTDSGYNTGKSFIVCEQTVLTPTACHSRSSSVTKVSDLYFVIKANNAQGNLSLDNNTTRYNKNTSIESKENNCAIRGNNETDSFVTCTSSEEVYKSDKSRDFDDHFGNMACCEYVTNNNEDTGTYFAKKDIQKDNLTERNQSVKGDNKFDDTRRCKNVKDLRTLLRNLGFHKTLTSVSYTTKPKQLEEITIKNSSGKYSLGKENKFNVETYPPLAYNGQCGGRNHNGGTNSVISDLPKLAERNRTILLGFRDEWNCPSLESVENGSVLSPVPTAMASLQFQTPEVVENQPPEVVENQPPEAVENPRHTIVCSLFEKTGDIATDNVDIVPDNIDIVPDNVDIVPDNVDIVPDNVDIVTDNVDANSFTKNFEDNVKSSRRRLFDKEDYISNSLLSTSKLGDNNFNTNNKLEYNICQPREESQKFCSDNFSQSCNAIKTMTGSDLLNKENEMSKGVSTFSILTTDLSGCGDVSEDCNNHKITADQQREISLSSNNILSTPCNLRLHRKGDKKEDNCSKNMYVNKDCVNNLKKTHVLTEDCVYPEGAAKPFSVKGTPSYYSSESRLPLANTTNSRVLSVDSKVNRDLLGWNTINHAALIDRRLDVDVALTVKRQVETKHAKNVDSGIKVRDEVLLETAGVYEEDITNTLFQDVLSPKTNFAVAGANKTKSSNINNNSLISVDSRDILNSTFYVDTFPKENVDIVVADAFLKTNESAMGRPNFHTDVQLPTSTYAEPCSKTRGKIAMGMASAHLRRSVTNLIKDKSPEQPAPCMSVQVTKSKKNDSDVSILVQSSTHISVEYDSPSSASPAISSRERAQLNQNTLDGKSFPTLLNKSDVAKDRSRLKSQSPLLSLQNWPANSIECSQRKKLTFMNNKHWIDPSFCSLTKRHQSSTERSRTPNKPNFGYKSNITSTKLGHKQCNLSQAHRLQMNQLKNQTANHSQYVPATSSNEWGHNFSKRFVSDLHHLPMRQTSSSPRLQEDPERMWDRQRKPQSNFRCGYSSVVDLHRIPHISSSTQTPAQSVYDGPKLNTPRQRNSLDSDQRYLFETSDGSYNNFAKHRPAAGNCRFPKSASSSFESLNANNLQGPQLSSSFSTYGNLHSQFSTSTISLPPLPEESNDQNQYLPSSVSSPPEFYKSYNIISHLEKPRRFHMEKLQGKDINTRATNCRSNSVNNITDQDHRCQFYKNPSAVGSDLHIYEPIPAFGYGIQRVDSNFQAENMHHTEQERYHVRLRSSSVGQPSNETIDSCPRGSSGGCEHDSGATLAVGGIAGGLICKVGDPKEASTSDICPDCHLPFDERRKRRLIDSCGHERCYNCVFLHQTCPVCATQVEASDSKILGESSLFHHSHGNQSPDQRSRNSIFPSQHVVSGSVVAMATMACHNDRDSPPPPPPDVAQNDLMIRLGLI